MFTWREFEDQALSFVAENYFPDATLVGGSDSTESDIFIPSEGFFIEVKKLPSQCGQFTEKTKAENPFSEQILSTILGLEGKENNFSFTSHLIKQWVKEHYTRKKVRYVVSILNGEMCLLTLEDFLNKVSFSGSVRRKCSGSTKAPKKSLGKIKEFLKENSIVFNLSENLIFCQTNFGEYFFINGEKYFISKSPICLGRVNKCSKTKSITVIFSIKEEI